MIELRAFDYKSSDKLYQLTIIDIDGKYLNNMK